MNALGDRLTRWSRTRRGVVTLALMTVGVLASVPVARSPVQALVTLAVVAAVCGLLVPVVAESWEQRTRPRPPPFARAGATGSRRMLRRDGNGRVFPDRGGFLFERRHFFVGTGCPPVRLAPEWVALAGVRQRTEPQRVASGSGRSWWWYQDAFYWENGNYDGGDVRALVAERLRRERRELARAHDLLAVEQDGAGPPGRIRSRERIPTAVKHAVFRRDGGRCVECGSDFDIQYDHVIPHSWGGAATTENLQLLCASCNRAKSASL